MTLLLFEWKYVESSSNYPSYDQQTLINELEYLDVSNMGNYFVLIYEFDDYKTIDLTKKLSLRTTSLRELL